jgi:hypothetical protein
MSHRSCQSSCQSSCCQPRLPCIILPLPVPVPCSPCGPAFPPCDPCDPCGSCRSSCKSSCGCKHKKSKRHCRCRTKIVPCYQTKCGFITATLTKTASPLVYANPGDPITYTYTITNTGSAAFCGPIAIVDSKIGSFTVAAGYTPPAGTFSTTRVYSVTAADITAKSVTNTATAYVQVKSSTWVVTPQVSATVTAGNADLYGSIVQTQSAPLTGSVTVNIVNNVTSTTAATNAVLSLVFPPGVSAVSALSATLPDTITSGATGPVIFTVPTIAIGATRTATFTYTTVATGSFTWSGTIVSPTFDPNLANNFVTSTLVIT